ncbi:MAG: NTP transferase domain-containing protein [Tessaracoccus sp.]|uniref:molybdenum cofactor guanylyltransferase n=1 Tax=Tessaracoccus sp. TaxID=1971211 RepID=UPI001EC8AF3E|nr:NTP transferase domain-containing protein [Tessaracoccus sp.]MBK7822741.1 NTP transferase domain-containing protein [Tessaracoccus sp.]
MRGAIVLGGGRSSRMGTDKLALLLDGRPLLARVVDAALTWADAVVVAGDQPEGWSSGDGVTFRREDPPFGGPVAGIAAAFAELTAADEVLILAGDLASPGAAVALLAAAEVGSDGVVLEDDDGWPQYLAGRYRAAALATLVDALAADPVGAVHRFMRPLDVARVRAPEATTRDVDTPEAARAAGAKLPQLGV